MFVKNKPRSITFTFVAEDDGNINASTLVSAFRSFFIRHVFENIFSADLKILAIIGIHSEGRLRLSESAVTDNNMEIPETSEISEEPMDMENRIRVTFERYNQSTPLFFTLAGIRQNIATNKMARGLLLMCREGISVENLSFTFAGLKNSSQVGPNNYIVGVDIKTQPLSKRQQENFANAKRML